MFMDFDNDLDTGNINIHTAVSVNIHGGPNAVGPRLRGWRNTVEIVLFEISNAMKPYPSVFTHTHTPANWGQR